MANRFAIAPLISAPLASDVEPLLRPASIRCHPPKI